MIRERLVGTMWSKAEGVTSHDGACRRGWPLLGAKPPGPDSHHPRLALAAPTSCQRSRAAAP